MTNDEAVKYLDSIAAQANMLARLYEDLAESIAANGDHFGFETEAEYEAHARDAFAADQESIDLGETRP